VAAGAVPLGQVGSVVPPVYEFAGPGVLERLLAALLHGRGLRTWERIARFAEHESERPVPFLMEPDLVGEIAFRELAFGAPPDGHPLDPQVQFAAAAARHPAFAGEPYDLPAALGTFTWPTVVLSGGRDLRTPRPVAERVARLAPDGLLVELPSVGHSLLDTHTLAALHVAHVVAAGAPQRLRTLASRIEALPRRGPSRWLAPLVRAYLAADELVPVPWTARARALAA
jgi:pimeloyl-ACP methyl ester carboxylesterase